MYTLSDGTQRKYRALITIPTAGIGSGGVSSHVLKITQDCFSSNALAAITAGGATAMQADGGDVCYAAANGVTRLATDVIKHSLNANPASTLLEHAIEYGSYSSAVENQRYVLWGGNGSETQPAAGAAYGQYAVYETDARQVIPFQEGSGLMAYDRTSNANNGTLTNGPTWATGGGVTFDGTNDYIACSFSPDGLAAISLEFVANLDTVRRHGLASNANPTATNSGIAITPYDDGIIYFDLGNGSTYARQTIAYSAGAAISVAGVWDGTTQKIFVNGTPSAGASISGTIASSGNQYRIAYYYGGNYMRGTLYVTRAYSRGRTTAEILTQHNNDASPGTFAVVGAVQSSSTVSPFAARNIRRRGSYSVFGIMAARRS